MPKGGWPCGPCGTGQHDQCLGTRQRFYFEAVKGKMKLTFVDAYNECYCKKKHPKPDVREDKP
jgi:hypothetical protein